MDTEPVYGGRWIPCGPSLSDIKKWEPLEMQVDPSMQNYIRRRGDSIMGNGTTDALSDKERYIRARALEMIAKDDEIIIDTVKKTAMRVAVSPVPTLTGVQIAKHIEHKIADRFAETDKQIEYSSNNRTDMVNHPPHYTSHPSGVECIQVTEHMNFCVGNAIKYLWRADKKGATVEDLKKAVWYLNREIKRRGDIK